jgi:hypothetical protein
MVDYTTSLAPPSLNGEAAARKGMTIQSPYASYGSNHQDILNAAGSQNAAAYAVANQQATAKLQAEYNAANNANVLQGLQQQYTAQQHDQSLGNTMFANMNGTVGGLLGGLLN